MVLVDRPEISVGALTQLARQRVIHYQDSGYLTVDAAFKPYPGGWAMNYVTRSSILIVEDESLIAMDLEQMLTDLGFRGVVSKASCPEAEEWMRANTPVFAILDIHLREGSCRAIAQDLMEREVPFIVSTGSDLSAEDDIFAQGQHVPKPCSHYHLARAIDALGISAVKSSCPR